MIQDSGERREFETGAVRDIQEGKGRLDLTPILEMSEVLEDDTLLLIGRFMVSGVKTNLIKSLQEFANTYYSEYRYSNQSIADMFLEVSIHYEEGAKKYGEHNWEKGIPLHCYIDSAVRHYLKYLRGDTDERHDRAFVWNILGALWTLNNKPELDDIRRAE